MQVRTAAEIGLMIRATRRERGLTQAALAQRAQVSTRWLIGMEAGKDAAELGLVLRVLAVLNLRLELAAGARPRRARPPAAAEPEAALPAVPSMQAVLRRLGAREP
ncbi:helix-turn-helix domain-containing protein [Roseomonas sp. 18066]|uniref:helix-turn-helix domain-containing protein n=1 Tax=Roseomonas sp. 18066 TaxID=2681412 RepID=UPI00135AA12D|nr:helix-turn-helix domain-containing protein [Roseomonas sp. 18066]